MKWRLTRVAFICGAIAAAFAIACGEATETRSAPSAATSKSAQKDSRPNLIVITLDTVRADFLGAYEGTVPKRADRIKRSTPNLDAQAKRGTRFDLAIGTAALTPVAHASILTGLDNREHGLRVLSAPSGYRLPDHVPTLTSVLHAEGYRTVAVHSAFPVAGIFGFGRDFDVFESFETDLPDGTRGEAWDINRFQRRSDETTKLVLEHLSKEDGPFFLWAHYWDPHDRKKLPPEPFYQETSRALAGGLGPEDLSGSETARLVYATEVSYLDQEIGRLFDALEERGQLANSIVVIVADHGQGLDDHGWFHHRILYQEQIRVPLLIAVPGHEQVASVGALVRTKDIFPTVLDYLGLEASAPVSGRSLRPLIEGRKDEPRLAFANQINGFDLDARMVARRPIADFIYVAMDQRWKLIYRPAHADKSELYHIEIDPGEATNLYGPSHEEAIRLKRELAHASPWVTRPFEAEASPTGDLDLDSVHEALTALGYVAGDDDASALPIPEFSWTCPDDPALFRSSADDAAGCPTPLIPIVRH